VLLNQHVCRQSEAYYKNIFFGQILLGSVPPSVSTVYSRVWPNSRFFDHFLLVFVHFCAEKKHFIRASTHFYLRFAFSLLTPALSGLRDTVRCESRPSVEMLRFPPRNTRYSIRTTIFLKNSLFFIEHSALVWYNTYCHRNGR
jgi:hypothetical protein